MKKELRCFRSKGLPTFDMEIDWHLTDYCNFSCEFCHPQISTRKNQALPYNLSVEEVVERFNNLGSCHILLSGGEPFLYPNFVELCKLLTEKHYISLNTNLSLNNVLRFADEIDPKKVLWIDAAFHVTEMEKLGISIDSFVEKSKILEKKGFEVHIIYVLYPPLLKRVEKDVKKLRDRGVSTIFLKPFKGAYNKHIYPDAYTEKERRKILSIENEYPFLKPYLYGRMCFVGELCWAGCKSFKVEVDGSVYRCMSVRKCYGNIFQGSFDKEKIERGPTSCPAPRVLSLAWCYRFLDDKRYFEFFE